MRTIPARYIGKPRGDYRAICAYCGSAWHRSEMYRDAAGMLVCPQEGKGRDAVTLDRINAANAAQVPVRHRPGNW